MLITFKTRAHYPNITMFGDVALQLLTLMGRRKTVPSAMDPEDIPAALEQLREGLRKQAAEGEQGATAEGDDDAETPVALGTRAVPLIELLDAAAKENVGVMWEEGDGFP